MALLRRSGCSAFSTFPNRKPNPVLPGFKHRIGAKLVHYTSPHDSDIRLKVSTPLELRSDQERSLKQDLKRALQYATDVDSRHGLCTKQSQKAWSVVDEIYLKIQSLQDDYEHASNPVQPVKPRQKYGRRIVVLRENSMSSGNEIEGIRYFF